MAVNYFIERMAFYDPKDIVAAEQLVKDSTLAFREVRDDAGSIGTATHDIAEKYLKKFIETEVRPESITEFLDGGMDPRIWASSRAVEELFKTMNFVPIETELLVGSEKVDAAGTLDFLFLEDGKLWVGDFKTSNSAVNDHYAIQVAAYAKFFTEMTGLKIEGAVIVWLSKDYAKVKLYDIPYMNRAYSVFKHQNAIYKWLKSEDKKLIERKNRLIIK